MNSLRKRIIILNLIVFALAALVIVFVWHNLAQTDARKLAPAARLDLPFPEFQLTNLLTGKTHNQLPVNRPVLVNVWATWCPSCYVEHPYLMTLAEQGVALVGLNYKDDREQAQLFLAQRGNPYQMVLFDADGHLALDLGVTGAPETYFVDANAVIRYRHIGVIDENNWYNDLQARYFALSASSQ